MFLVLALAGLVLPMAVAASVATIVGANIRNRIEARTYRTWLKRALFAMALILVGQFAYRA